MIDSTSSPDPAARSAAYTGPLQQPSLQRGPADTDRLSTEQADKLQQALGRDPELRPDVVARGRQLASDPGYPSAAIIANVAAQIVNSPDPSEALS
ncbi:MAG: hypothetical protein ACREFX_10625 [Opitutaceae bacterium]